MHQYANLVTVLLLNILNQALTKFWEGPAPPHASAMDDIVCKFLEPRGKSILPFLFSLTMAGVRNYNYFDLASLSLYLGSIASPLRAHYSIFLGHY